MNKEQIESIALEVLRDSHCDMTTTDAVNFARDFLTRIDAERGKDAKAWLITGKQLGVPYQDVTQRQEVIDRAQSLGYKVSPLFLSPTIPEGMAMVDKKLLALAIDLTKEAGEEEFSRLPLSDELHGLSLMLDAAQGERNAD